MNGNHEKVTFKIPDNNNVYVPKEYYTKTFSDGYSFRSEEEVKVYKPEFDGDWSKFVESNKINNSEIPWGDIPKGNYMLLVDFIVSKEGEISDINPSFMDQSYPIYRDRESEILKNPFIIKNPGILNKDAFGQSYRMNPNTIDHPAFKSIKEEVIRLISMGRWKPAYLHYYNANKKIPVNFKITGELFMFNNN